MCARLRLFLHVASPLISVEPLAVLWHLGRISLYKCMKRFWVKERENTCVCVRLLSLLWTRPPYRKVSPLIRPLRCRLFTWIQAKSPLIVYLSPSPSRSKVDAERRRVGWVCVCVCGGEYEYPRGDKWVCLCLYENVAFTSPEGEELYYRVAKNQNRKTSEGLCIPARFEQNGFKQIFLV